MFFFYKYLFVIEETDINPHDDKKLVTYIIIIGLYC